MGSTEPNRSWGAPESSWLRIVGIIALADCRGPNVLNGRMVDIGKPNVREKLSASLSAPIFVAE